MSEDDNRSDSLFTELGAALIGDEEKKNELRDVVDALSGTSSSRDMDQTIAAVFNSMGVAERQGRLEKERRQVEGGRNEPTVNLVEMRDSDTTLGMKVIVDAPPHRVELLQGDHKVVVREDRERGTVEKDVSMPFNPHAVREEHPENRNVAVYVVAPPRAALPAGDPDTDPT